MGVGAATIGTVIGTFALGPLIVAGAIGIGVALDNHFGFTERSKLNDVFPPAAPALAPDGS